jgi:hypothetical protein
LRFTPHHDISLTRVTILNGAEISTSPPSVARAKDCEHAERESQYDYAMNMPPIPPFPTPFFAEYAVDKDARAGRGQSFTSTQVPCCGQRKIVLDEASIQD